MFRGGGYYDYAYRCRAADRYYSDPTVGASGMGFRSVLPAGQ